MSRLALVRHGRTPWNAARRIQGSTDVSLDEEGRAQARDAAARLAQLGTWTAVTSSPMDRARETAAIIADGLALPLLDPLDELAERDCGLAEGLTVDEAHARWPSLEYPEAESLATVGLRVARSIALIDFGVPGAIVVSHGQALRRGIERLTGAPSPRIANGETILVERHDGHPHAWRRLERA